MSSAEDYEWADDWYDSIGQAYCLTLAEGLTSAQFLARIAAVPSGTSEGLETIGARSQELWEQDPVTGAVIGVTEVRDADGKPWALSVEVNGFLGATPGVIGPLSAGTRVVSHFANASAECFYWMADGRVALTFDPLFPQDREGTESKPAARMLRAAGFNLADDAENIDHPTASAFALAQQITKVEVTRDFLETATYELGIAPHPAPLPAQCAFTVLRNAANAHARCPSAGKCAFASLRREANAYLRRRGEVGECAIGLFGAPARTRVRWRFR
jgi:hypothetical protein